MDRLSELVKNLTSLLEELIRVEERKLEAARDGRVVAVEDCMKEEQVFTMQFRACEKKVDEVLTEEGFAGKSLSGIIPLLSGKRREELEALQRRLQDTLSHYHEVSDAAAELMKVQLYKMDRKLEEAGKGKAAEHPGPGQSGKGFHPRKA